MADLADLEALQSNNPANYLWNISAFKELQRRGYQVQMDPKNGNVTFTFEGNQQITIATAWQALNVLDCKTSGEPAP